VSAPVCLRSRACQIDGLDDRGIVILRLVDARRYRPHAHRLGRERLHQVVRVGLLAQPARAVAGRNDQRHAVVNLGDHLVGVCRDDRERADPISTTWRDLSHFIVSDGLGVEIPERSIHGAGRGPPPDARHD
jgi:hypothetical protein